MRSEVSTRDYGAFKYHIDIDGNSNAWSGLMTKLLSGGLVFKVSPEEDQQWYYSRLLPWRHFVPVAESMEDLVTCVRWAVAHPADAARIARRGRRFAERLKLVEEACSAVSTIETALSRRPYEL